MSLSLPEVTPETIPGAGSTQRLPRLIGLPAAIEWICGACRVPAQRAFDLGALDLIAEEDLLDTAVRFAIVQATRRMLQDRKVPPASEANLAAAEAAAIQQGQGRPQVLAAIEAIRSSIQCGLSD